MKILLVEDDDRIADAVAEALTDQHYLVELAANGLAGWELLEAFTYDLLLLDVMLPKLDGISLCQRLRDRGYQLPVLLLTARDTLSDKIIGLDAGADDYLVKPFEIDELLARMRALLRRGNATLPPVLIFGSLCLNPSNHEVTYGGQLLNFTPKEYLLLYLFLANQQRVFSRSVILDRVWDAADQPEAEAVKVHIKGIRQKLRAVGAPPDLIETVHGVGYRLKQIP